MSTVYPNPNWPELSVLCAIFHQDWDSTEHASDELRKVLYIEAIAVDLRNRILQNWLSSPEKKQEVRTEIKRLLEKCKTGEECEKELDIDFGFSETFGVDLRILLQDVDRVLEGRYPEARSWEQNKRNA